LPKQLVTKENKWFACKSSLVYNGSKKIKINDNFNKNSLITESNDESPTKPYKKRDNIQIVHIHVLICFLNLFNLT